MKAVGVFEVGSLKVHLVPDDITKIATDVIVSSDDTDLSMSGGVSKRILEQAGEGIRQEALLKNPGAVGEVIATSGGNLDIKSVLHAQVIDYSTGDLPERELVMSLTLTCLDEANRAGHSSIAIPPIGAGAGRLDSTESAEAIVEGISRWSSNEQITLTDVYIATLSVQEDTLRSFLMSLMERRVGLVYEKRIVELQAKVTELENSLDEIQGDSLDDVPHPIAYLRAKADVGISAFERARTLCACVESVVRYTVSIMISLGREARLIDEDDAELVGKPLSFGNWVGLLRNYSQLFQGNQKSVTIPGIAYCYLDDKGKLSAAGRSIDEAVTIRNTLLHSPGGATPSESVCRALEDDLRSGIDRVIEEFGRRVPRQLSIVREIVGFTADAYPRYTVGVLHGVSSLFPNVEIESPDRLDPGMVGIWSKESKRFLTLHPFMTYKTCPQCEIESVFFLDEVRKNSIGRWWNYADGHVVQGPLVPLGLHE